jgi:hypothetical protein
MLHWPKRARISAYRRHILRNRVIRRDGFNCKYCKKELMLSEITIDHIIPLSRGGTWREENLVVACKDCNEKKRNNLMEETVPCKYCNKETSMTGTKLCDNCWELEVRMRSNIEVAEKILNAVKEEKQYQKKENN